MRRLLTKLKRWIRLRPIQPCVFGPGDRSDVALVISMAEQLEAQQR
ncbi:hypothetical protein RISK_000160 [Rhodopirellula islandica]|uniref:Uncharacterized protein n=1 Tax=Rhodopirellula islandica TaxID=595434 RepID=A0A0J1BMR8_RHOIS|nr:hypothetical protein RISK_000160 [Rhodopirellula islandica]